MNSKDIETGGNAMLRAASKVGPVDWTPEHKVKALTALVDMVETCLQIVDDHHYRGVPEPHPGAVLGVINNTQLAITVARNTGLIPKEKERRA